MNLERYSRQARFSGVGAAGQQRIAAACVVVVGIGALGSVSANVLARAGVGSLRLIDRDIVDLSNLQRQVLFSEQDARDARPKALAAAEFLRLVNSDIDIEAVVREVDAQSVEQLIADADVVVDGSDNFELRYLLNDACVKHGIPWIYGGALGATGTTATIVPGETACLECLIGPMPDAGTVETCATAGVLAMATGVVANIQAAEALKLLTGNAPRREVLYIDLWTGTHNAMRLSPDPNCPVCGSRRFPYLNSNKPTRVRALCGNETLQVRPAALAGDVDVASQQGSAAGEAPLLERLAERLRRLGEVQVSDQMVRLKTDTLELTLFADGRALIRGARDEADALRIYAEYVGM